VCLVTKYTDTAALYGQAIPVKCLSLLFHFQLAVFMYCCSYLPLNTRPSLSRLSHSLTLLTFWLIGSSRRRSLRAPNSMVIVHDELQRMWKEAGEAWCFSISVSWVEGQKKTATNQSYIALPYLNTSVYHIWYDIYVFNCSWVGTRWQLFSTHIRTIQGTSQNKQYREHKNT